MLAFSCTVYFLASFSNFHYALSSPALHRVKRLYKLGGSFPGSKNCFDMFSFFFFKVWGFFVFVFQKGMFQFKKSILFSINPGSLFRLRVLKMLRISKESSKVRSSLKAKKLCFVLIFSLPFFSVMCMWAYVYPLIHLILFGEMAVYFLPFRGWAVISCFDLSLSFFHPCRCLLILPQHLQQPTEKKRWSHICFDEGFTGRNTTSPTQKQRWASPAFHPSLPLVLLRHGTAAKQMSTHLPDQDWLRSCWEHQHGKLSSGCVCLWGVSWSLLNNTCALASFPSTQCVWFRSHLVSPTCGSLEERCSCAPWWHPQQNGKSHVYNPLDAPLVFPCNSEAWGDDWLKWVIKTVLAFSLGSPAFEVLHTQPGVPVSRCCSRKRVNQCRLAEAMTYIERQMFNNEPRKVVRRTWMQLPDGKKNGLYLPLPVSLDITSVLLKNLSVQLLF